jgi:hypothetical protein
MSITYQQQSKLTYAEAITKKWSLGSFVVFHDCHDWKTAEEKRRLIFLNEPPKIIICKGCRKEKKLNLSPFQMRTRKFCGEKCYLEWMRKEAQKRVNKGVGLI